MIVKKSYRLCVFAIMAFVYCGMVGADIIKLKDGSLIDGKIIAKTDDIIIIQVEEGTKKIYRKDIQEITGGDGSGTITEATKNRFRIDDIGKTPISDLESDAGNWLEKLKPTHGRQSKSLAGMQRTIRLNKMGIVYAGISGWCKRGFSSIGMDDLDKASSLLLQCETKLRKDINLLNTRGSCLACHGTGLADCNECGGRGTKVRYVKTRITNVHGTKAGKKRKITEKCLACRGTGKEPCIYKNEGVSWKLGHEPEKRMKKIGGLEKMAILEMVIKERRSDVNRIKAQIRQNDTGHLRKLAKWCHQEKYYYLTLQILQRLNEKTK